MKSIEKGVHVFSSSGKKVGGGSAGKVPKSKVGFCIYIEAYAYIVPCMYMGFPCRCCYTCSHNSQRHIRKYICTMSRSMLCYFSSVRLIGYCAACSAGCMALCLLSTFSLSPSPSDVFEWIKVG